MTRERERETQERQGKKTQPRTPSLKIKVNPIAQKNRWGVRRQSERQETNDEKKKERSLRKRYTQK